jgi:histone deacetylase 1/2
MLRCDSTGDLYTFSTTTATSPLATLAITTTIWYARLGHPAPSVIDTLRNNAFITCNKVDQSLCHSCQLGKHVRLPFTRSQTRSTAPFDLIHCDVWTSPVASISGCQYYLVLLDDYSHFCWTYPLVRKSEVASIITDFCAYAHTQFGALVKSFQADNGTEFVNRTLTTFFSSRGILLQLSCPYTSQQNGKAKRVLGMLNNISRTLFIHTHMPPRYWAEAHATATYVLNHRPCSSVDGAVPYTLLHGTTPDYDQLRVFGCLCIPTYPPLPHTSLLRALQLAFFWGILHLIRVIVVLT